MEAPQVKKQKVKAYYEAEAEDYDQQFYLQKDRYPTLRYRHRYILEIVNAIELPSNAVILDVGCGPGEMVIDLIDDQRKIHGIDIAQDMIDLATSRLKKHLQREHKVSLATGGLEKLDFQDHKFDLVICSGIVEYLKGDEKWLAEVKRVLKTGGNLIINVTNKYAIRRWTAGLVEPLKNSKLIFKMMNFIKSKILRRGKLHHFPFKPRVHGPYQFDRLLEANAYKKSATATSTLPFSQLR